MMEKCLKKYQSNFKAERQAISRHARKQHNVNNYHLSYEVSNNRRCLAALYCVCVYVARTLVRTSLTTEYHDWPVHSS